MATAPTHPVIRYVRQLAASRLAADLPDQELLGHFTGHRDQAAFAALVRRHGPLVLGVCRRVLHDWHAAEDALQATFLLLACRAGSIRRRESLAAWLHAVALRTALKAKARAARRRACERQAAAAPAVEHPDDLVWRDLRPVLDEAVDSLPEKYRVPVVLCYLQGRSVSEVARLLGCPRGTVAANLARGRQRLRARLTRKGVVLSAAVLGTALCQRAGAAAPLAGRAVGTVLSVAARSSAGGVTSACVGVTTKGVFRAMSTMKVQVAGAALLAGVVGLGVTAGVYRARSTEPGAAAQGAPQAAPPVQPAGAPPAPVRRPAAYLIEPPDILLVQGCDKVALGGRPLDGQRLVRPDGTISLGAAGAVPVAGLSTDQAADAIARQLTRVRAVTGLTTEQVREGLTVDVLAYNSKSFYVITDLAGQGETVYRFPFSGSETVLDAVAEINGLPAAAGRCRVWVERRDAEGGTAPQVLPVNWQGLTERGEARTNYVLCAGDRVYVESEEKGSAAPGGAARRPPAEGDLNRQLRSAFGDGGEAVGAAVKLEVRSLRMVLAANSFRVEADGRVRLAPCWLVQGGGEPGGAEAPEGVALHCREAFLTFDGPVRGPDDVGRHRLTAVEPVGDVRITFPPGAPGRAGRD